MEIGQTPVNFNLPDDVHTAIKVVAAKRKKTMRDWMVEKLTEAVSADGGKL